MQGCSLCRASHAMRPCSCWQECCHQAEACLPVAPLDPVTPVPPADTKVSLGTSGEIPGHTQINRGTRQFMSAQDHASKAAKAQSTPLSQYFSDAQQGMTVILEARKGCSTCSSCTACIQNDRGCQDGQCNLETPAMQHHSHDLAPCSCMLGLTCRARSTACSCPTGSPGGSCLSGRT